MKAASSLESWAAQQQAALKRKQAALDESQAESAEALKEQGNAAFKKGDFTGAEVLYSASLAREETATCYCNRALVRIKTVRFDEAVQDCTRALELDPNSVKARARRGQAYSMTGKHDLAMRDFLEACALEPTNVALQREAAREQAIIDAVIQGSAATPPTGSSKATKSLAAASTTKVVELDSSSSFSGTPKPKEARPSSSTASTKSVLAAGKMESVTLAALRIADESVLVPSKAPQSLYAFEKQWRDMKHNPLMRLKLLAETMEENDYATCFAKSLEPELLLEILRTLPLPSTPEAKRVVLYLTRQPSFELTKLFLTSENKALLSRFET